MARVADSESDFNLLDSRLAVAVALMIIEIELNILLYYDYNNL